MSAILDDCSGIWVSVQHSRSLSKNFTVPMATVTVRGGISGIAHEKASLRVMWRGGKMESHEWVLRKGPIIHVQASKTLCGPLKSGQTVTCL